MRIDCQPYALNSITSRAPIKTERTHSTIDPFSIFSVILCVRDFDVHILTCVDTALPTYQYVLNMLAIANLHKARNRV